MSKSEPIILNLSDRRHKAELLGSIMKLEGHHRVSIQRVRPTRTLSQNGWYWGCILPCVARGMSEMFGEHVTSEDAHAFAKATFLARPLINRATGEQVGTIPGSTATLDTAGFSEFADTFIAWAADYLNVQVPPPGDYEPAQDKTNLGPARSRSNPSHRTLRHRQALI